MSLSDIKSVQFDGQTVSTGSPAAINITTTVTPTASINISGTPASTDVVEVQVPGIQGPAGLQNVFVQATDPSDGTWGAEETNYVWIQV